MSDQSLHCPHCSSYLGKAREDGTAKVRLAITLLDGERVHGPCPKCKEDVTVATSATLNKALCLSTSRVVPAIRLTGSKVRR